MCVRLTVHVRAHWSGAFCAKVNRLHRQTLRIINAPGRSGGQQDARCINIGGAHDWNPRAFDSKAAACPYLSRRVRFSR